MSARTLLVSAALAASASATPTFFGFGNDSPWYCWAKELVAVPAGFPVHNLPAASSFCSSYLSIAPATSTVTQTVTAARTATVSKAPVTATITPTTSVPGSTATVTPTTTVPSSVKTCYFTPVLAGQIAARTAAPEAAAEPWGWGVDYTAAVRDACACDGVNLSPAAVTTTTTTTVTATLATATVGGQTTTVTGHAVTITGAPSTATAPAATVTSGVATSTIPPSGTYSAGNTQFLEFKDYDFYGNDLDAQYVPPSLPPDVTRGESSEKKTNRDQRYCGTNGKFSLPNNSSVPCTDFASCTSACAAYNGATGSKKCVGVSYLKPNVFCYLKTTVNVCSPMPNSNVDSAAVVSS